MKQGLILVTMYKYKQKPNKLGQWFKGLFVMCIFIFTSNLLVGQCSGNDYDSGGSNGNYSNHENITKTFSAPPGSKLVLTFNSFNLETNYDFMYIYDGTSTSDPLLATLTGSNISGPFISSGSSLTIRFTSDYSVTKSGWNISLSCLTVLDCTNIPTLEFDNPQLLSGSFGAVGSTYRFSDVLSGSADAIMTIQNKSHSDIQIYSLDETSSTFGGYEEAFQPIIDYNWVNGGGNFDPPGDKFVTFKVDFVSPGTTTPVIIPQLAITGIDIDGSGQNGEVREFIRSSGYQSYSKQSTSTLSLSGGLKAQGPITNYPNIDDTALDVMLSFNFSGVSSITFDYGANYGGSSSLADSGVGNSDEKRHNSLYFKCYGFDETVCQPVDPPSGIGDSRCGPGPVQLSASGCNGTVRWYESANGGTSVHNGNTFVTPILNATKVYYIECYDVGCVSDIRTSVTANILDANCFEICDNGIDDDGDGFFDCFDLDCGQVLNRNFDEGQVEWFLYNQSGNNSTFSIDANSELEGINSAYIDITAVSGTEWHTQFGQGGMDIENGKTYVITFDAKSTGNKSISVSAQLDKSPWTSYFYQSLNLTTTDSTYQYEFTANTTVTDEVNLLFNLGLNTRDVWIDNVQFKEDCKVCESIPDTLLNCVGLNQPLSVNLPDPIGGDAWSFLNVPDNSFPIIDAATGQLDNLTGVGQYTAIISGTNCPDTVDIIVPLCENPCLCDDAYGQGFSDWSNLGIVPINGPDNHNFTGSIPGHTNVNVNLDLASGGESYWGANVFTEPDRLSFASLNYVGLNDPIYLRTGSSNSQSITFDFDDPIGDFDLLLFDIDQNDEVVLTGIDGEGNAITDFSDWVIRGIGDATLTEIGGDHLVAAFPETDLANGRISSSVNTDYDQNFIAIRPNKLIQELTIEFSSNISASSIFIDIYGSVLATECEAQENTNCLSEFNLISFGEVFLENSDIQGKACFCDSTFLTNFSIGGSFDVGGYEDMVYADGEFSMTNGAIQGGYIMGSNAINLSSVTNEIGNFLSGEPTAFEFQNNFPVDCNAEKQYFLDLSAYFDAQGSNGNFSQSGGVKYFDCNNLSGTVYFDVKLSDFSSEDAVLLNHQNAESIIINFMDSDPEIHNMSFDQNFEDNSSKIIFNFPNASRLRISAVGVKATVLAPDAQLVMENGHIDGNVIVNGFVMDDGSLSSPNGTAGELHTCVNEVDCTRSTLFDGMLPDIGYTGCKFHIEQDEFCVGETIQLFPSTGVIWSSDNPTVASISEEGLVSSLSEGLVNLTYIDKSTGCDSKDTVTLDMGFCLEICHDGIDNDGDGMIDCDDTDCIATNLTVSTNLIHDCNNNQSGSIDLGLSGGVSPYIIEWSDIPDPRAYWGFNGTTNDLSGYANHENKSSSLGSTRYNLDAMEGSFSMEFDGNTYLRYSMDNDFMEVELDQWMLSFWMKPTDLNGLEYIFDEGGGTNGISIRLNNDQLEFAVRDNNVQVNAGSHQFPNDGEWHYVLAYFQNDSIGFYLDGVKTAAVKTNFTDAVISDHSGNGGFGMLDGGSAFGSGSGSFYIGLLDGVKYYVNQDFTLDQIDDLARNDGVRTHLASDTFSVIIKDAQGYCHEHTDIIIGNGSTLVDLGADYELCEGLTTTLMPNILGPNAPFTVNWSNGLGTGTTKTVLPSTNSTYTVTVTDAFNCTAVDDVDIMLTPPISLVMDLNGTICLEGDSKLSADVSGGNGNYSYNWIGPNSFSSNEDTIEISNHGNYYLTVTDPSGCEASTSGYVYQSYNPFIVSLGTEICEGDSINLQITSSSAVSYLWSSNAGDAVSSAVTVTPQVPSSTYVVTVTNDLGCESTAEMSIDVNPYPIVNILGSDTICEGDTTLLTSVGEGTWQSINPGIAIVSEAGVVTGNNAGSSSFTFTQNSTGCSSQASSPVVVLAKPTLNIIGPTNICLSDTSLIQPNVGGIWESSDDLIATITNDGIITPLSAGMVVFNFTDTLTGCTSNASNDFQVYPKPIAYLEDTAIICEEETTNLSPISGGIWTSLSTELATVNNDGLIIGLTAGEVNFVYEDSVTGCYSDTINLLINPKPEINLTGPDSLCLGLSTTIASDLEGIWMSPDSTLIQIDSTGAINTLLSGQAKVVLNSVDGCVSDTASIVIHPIPAVAVSGEDSICIGFQTNLLPNTGGVWQSSDTSLAIVNHQGEVTGLDSGNVSFSFTSDHQCPSDSTADVYVNPNTSITLEGVKELCVGESVQLIPSYGVATGVWESSDTSIASIDSQGNILAKSPGTVSIGFLHNTILCYENPIVSITVYENPVINAGSLVSLCQGTTAVISTNVSGGVWSSSNNSIATISNSGLISGISPGATMFSVSHPTTGCTTEISDSIIVDPEVNVVIDFNGSLCYEDTSKLSTIIEGGTSPYSYQWSGPNGFSSTLEEIEIDTNGNYYVTVTDVKGCTDNISGFVYQRYDPFIFTLNSEVCERDEVTLSVNSATAVSYQWDSNAGDSTTASVTVTPQVPSSSYQVTVTNDLGCKTVALAEIDVIASPVINLAGPSDICQGDTSLVVPNTGGIWTSSNASIASITNGGIVTGHLPGSVFLTFEDEHTGCTDQISSSISVAEKAIVNLTGPDSLCIGQASSVTANLPGIWVSSDPTKVAVTPTGVVLGNQSGDAVLSYYENSLGCKSDNDINIYVHPIPTTSYLGPETVCVDDTTSIVSTSSGQWISLNTTHAIIDDNGQITAVQPGTARFIFTSNSSGCSSNPSDLLNINQRPTLNMGTLYKLCEESQATISPNSGGHWYSLDTAIASINDQGIITGIDGGVVGFQFLDTLTGCLSDTTRIIEIESKPIATFEGPDTLCQGETSNLSPSINGYWVSSDPNLATIANNGLVEAVSPGHVTFTFTSDEGICTSEPSDTLVVLTLPNISISGPTALCIGDSSQMLPANDGLWQSSDNSIAVIDNNGLVVATGQGTAHFTYHYSPTGCISKQSMPLLVYPDPNAQVLGSDEICIGQSTNLFPSNGGIWTSSNTNIATITSGGVVTGNSPGFVDFTFQSQSTGCVSTIQSPIQVTPKPIVSISGDNILCEEESTTLSPSFGGYWIANNPGVAVTDSSGNVQAISQGVATFKFTTHTGCIANNTAPLIVYDRPIIVNQEDNLLCLGENMTLLPSTGGSWESSDSTIATINSAGLVTPLTNGLVSFLYTDQGTSCQSNPSEIIEILPKTPVNLIGDSIVCIGGTTQFSPTTGGLWYTTDPTIATINSSGLVTGIDTGTVAFYFLNLTTNCFSDTTVNITVAGSSIPQFVDESYLCRGDTTYIQTASSGGTWEVANPTVASIDNTGRIIGLGQGNTKFRYIENTGCTSVWSAPFTVNDPPGVSTLGSNIICIGETATINPSSGGYWEVEDSLVLHLDSPGVVMGMDAGSTHLKFTDTLTGCISEDSIMIQVLDNPRLDNLGDSLLCVGFTTQLSSLSSNPIWFTSDSRVANVDQNGKVTAKAPGKTEIYTIDAVTGCRSQSDDVIIYVEKCFNHDFNVTQTFTTLTGNVETNDDKNLNVFYNYDDIFRSSQYKPDLTIDSLGNYTFFSEEDGKYIYDVDICKIQSPSECFSTILEITVVGSIFAKNNVVNNLEYASAYADSLPSNPGGMISAMINSNDKCVNSLGCALDDNQRSIQKNSLFGTASLSSPNRLSYQPGSNFIGFDTINYSVCSGSSKCQSSSLFLTVRKRNAKNTLDAPDDFNFMATGVSVSGNAMENDFDPEGDSLSVLPQGSIGNLISVAGGGYYIESNGDYAFIPDPEFVGNTSFVYTVCDDNINQICKDATVHLMVYGDMTVSTRVYLEGALMTNNNEVSPIDGRPLMRDDLRNNPFSGQNSIPITDPYSGFVGLINLGATYTHEGPGILSENQVIVDSATVFGVTGPNAIVDWVFMEIRSKNDSTAVLATRSALLQRDGDIVDLDGVSPVKFTSFGIDSFYLVVNHRSHLGVMSQLVPNDRMVDFTNPNTPIYDFGTNNEFGLDYTGLAMNSNVKNGYRALWSGDFDGNGKIKFTNPDDDQNMLFFEVLFHNDNLVTKANFDFGYGYAQGDFNMNGKIKFTNPNDDKNLIFGQIILYPLNTSLLDNFNFFIEQIPK